MSIFAFPDRIARSVTAWWTLDDNMPKVNRAWAQVRDELCEVGLLDEGVFLDCIELEVEAIASSDGFVGVCFEDPGTARRLIGYREGVIYLPCDLPKRPFKPGGTLADIIRHEYAHAWRWLNPGLFSEPWFAEAFGAEYDDKCERPPQPILTSQIAWRVDLFHPVSKESGHGAAGRSAEVCGVASAAAAL